MGEIINIRQKVFLQVKLLYPFVDVSGCWYDMKCFMFLLMNIKLVQRLWLWKFNDRQIHRKLYLIDTFNCRPISPTLFQHQQSTTSFFLHLLLHAAFLPIRFFSSSSIAHQNTQFPFTENINSGGIEYKKHTNSIWNKFPRRFRQPFSSFFLSCWHYGRPINLWSVAGEQSKIKLNDLNKWTVLSCTRKLFLSRIQAFSTAIFS